MSCPSPAQLWRLPVLGAGEMAQRVKVLAKQAKGPELFRAPAPMEMLGRHRVCLSFCILGDGYRGSSEEESCLE